RLRLLQEVDDVPILMRALAEPLLFRGARERRFPAALLGERLRHRRAAHLRAPDRTQYQRRFARASVEEADRETAVVLGQDLRWHRQADHLVAGRQYDLVALDTERPIEDQRLAVQVIALRILVGLEDDDATTTLLG